MFMKLNPTNGKVKGSEAKKVNYNSLTNYNIATHYDVIPGVRGHDKVHAVT